MHNKIVRYFVICLLATGFAGCGSDHDHGSHVAKGGVYYGGVFRLNWVTNFRSLYPQNVTEVTAFNITSQVYEGLVKLSPKDLSIEPCLATRWEHNDSNTVWTFHLRKGVKFHDDPCFPDNKGREVTAKDFKWCFDLLCTAYPQNGQFEVTFKDRVAGANEYYNASADKKPLPAGGVSGIQAVNDSTLTIRLSSPFGGFMNLLTEPGCCVFPKEAYDKYNIEMRIHMVGTGPFMMKEVIEEQSIVLTRNPNYWDYDQYGNQLPYLDAVKFTFLHEKKAELLQFQEGNLEMMYQIPTEITQQILGQLNGANAGKVDYSLDVKPAMSTYFFGFQMNDPLFKNKLLRQAFCCAIDRLAIVNSVMQGEGSPGDYGIVPFGAFPGYNYNLVKDFYKFDPNRAKELMAKAGYPGGKGFPEDVTLQTSSDGGQRNVQIAEVVQNMLKENLGITVKINAVPLPQHEDAFLRGKVPLFRELWSADYPDPQTFLNTLYGANVPKDTSAMAYTNSTRYVNPEFDSLYVHALLATSDSVRYRLFAEADKVALEDAPYLCIYYEENYYLYHNYVKNFYGNSMDYLDFTKVYIIPANKRVSPTNTPSSPNN